jgi:hypothetical protein
MTSDLEIPFAAPNLQIKALTPWDGRHRTLWSSIVPLADKWLLFYREASCHPYDGASQIRMQVTQSKGMQFDPPVTIYDEPGVDAKGCNAFMMENGRIGVLCSRTSAAGYNLPPVFIWSDDAVTWHSHIVTGDGNLIGWTNGTMQVHKLQDGSGYIAYSSKTTEPGSPVIYLKITGNGTVFTTGVAIAGIAGVTLSTLAIVRLGESDRWVMLARRQDGDFTTYAFKSTDMIHWDGPFDTGQNLADNPHNAMYWRGDIYWLACSRVTAGGDVPRPLGPIQDGFVHQSADADDLWGTDFEEGWPGWSECCSVFGMEGHPTFFTDANDDTYCVFGFNRSTTNNSTSIGLMGPTAMVVDFSAANNTVRPLTAADRLIASGGDLVPYAESMRSVGAQSYIEIFNLSGKQGIELLDGIVLGSAVGYRLTIDGQMMPGGSTFVQAEDNGGVRFSIATVPAATAEGP